MPQYRSFTGKEPRGTIIVRVVASAKGPRAFIREVRDPADIAEDAIEQSEEMPVEEALALARNKSSNMKGPTDVVIELAPDTEWNESWGNLG
ncbi:hypothetical protein [Pelagibacterium lentulum]|uniref:Uncharacterized protein n=1 Tax=Pelagibacterium lentulum TaxID=2029865 RepID=A0A916R8H8_9HYPH|nr:hypothetical protein [Pelagibacterium lentulum]GGA40865.1 hypothetical protein GCM10011499_08050 [Pelagibacterium lentulum]